MAVIDIFSVMGKNGVLFSEFLHQTMIHLSSGENVLNFYCFMSSRVGPPKGWKHLESILKQKHTSLNHTTGLNRALDYIKGDYVILVDVDVAILTPDWDKKMISHMSDNRLDILGVDHWDHPQGYQQFPVVTFFLAKSKIYSKVCPDLRPHLVEYPNKWGLGAKLVKIRTSKEADIFGKPIGESLLRDSGWQLPCAYKKANLRSGVFEKAPKCSILEVPQAWKFGDELIICHKGKSSKRRQSKGFKFIKSIKNYLERAHGIQLT